MLRLHFSLILRPRNLDHAHACRLATARRRLALVPGRGPLSDRRLLRVHAAAAPRPQALRRAGRRSCSPRTTRGAGTSPSTRRPSSCGPAWSRSPRQILGCSDPPRPRPAGARHRARQAEGQPLLAARAGRACRPAAARALRRAAAAGLSRTQDDKGRVRWTLFGGSEQGPARASGESFFTAPRRRSCPTEQALASFAGCCARPTASREDDLADLRRPASASCREGTMPLPPSGRKARCPRWTKPFLLGEGRARCAA